MKSAARLVTLSVFAVCALILAGCDCCHPSRIVGNEPESLRHFGAADPGAFQAMPQVSTQWAKDQG